jgi:hypothetical protein
LRICECRSPVWDRVGGARDGSQSLGHEQGPTNPVIGGVAARLRGCTSSCKLRLASPLRLGSAVYIETYLASST